MGPLIAGLETVWAAFTATEVGAFLTTTIVGRLLVTAAASLLVRAMSHRNSPSLQKTGIVTQVTQEGGANPLSFCMGKTATNGAWACPPMTQGNTNEAPNSYMTYVIELGCIPGDELLQTIINGEYVTFSGAADPDYGTPATGKYAGYCWLKYYNGSQTAADPMLVSKFGSYPDRPWTSDMIGRDLCYAIVTFKLDQSLWNGDPTCRFVMQGIPLYDPRQDSTVGGSGSQIWSDRSTWGPSNNPYVQKYNLARGITIPGLNKVYGGGYDASDLPLDTWFAAMNEADRAVNDGNGGTEIQYETGIEVLVNKAPLDVMSELLKGSAGKIADVGGSLTVHCGEVALPSYFITDDDILVSEAEDYSPFPGLRSTYNGASATYPEPSAQWETTDAPPLYNTTYEGEDQGQELVAALTFQAVSRASQVQRLMASYVAEERRFRRHGITLPPEAMALEPFDAISWTSAYNGYTSKTFEVAEVQDDPHQCLQVMSLQERDSSDFNASGFIVHLPTPVPGGTPTPTPQTVPSFAVTAISLLDATGVARRPAIKITWTGGVVPDAYGLQWELRLSGATAASQSGATQDTSSGQYILDQALIPATAYEVRAKMIVHRPSNWSNWLPVTTDDTRMTALDLAQSITDAINAAQATADQANTDLATVNSTLTAAVNAAQSQADVNTGQIALAIPRRVQTDTAISQISSTLASLSAQMNDTQTRMAGAGIYVDAATGKIKIDAVNRLDNKLSDVSITLDSLQGQIDLRATTSYVDTTVSNAMLDPTQIPVVNALQTQVNDVQVQLDANTAAISLKADQTTVSSLSSSLTTAESDISANTAAITNKVNTTDFNSLTTRVTNVETDISAVGGANFGFILSQAQVQAPALDKGAINTIGALLSQHQNNEQALSDLAYARQAWNAQVTSNRVALATAKTELGAAIDANTALIQTEQQTRASADSSLASQITTLQTSLTTADGSITGNASAITSLQASVTSINGSISSLTTTTTSLQNQITTANGNITGNSASISTLTSSVTTNGNNITSLTSQTNSLTSTVNGLSSTVTTQGSAISTLQGAAGAGYLIKAQAGAAVSLLDLVAADGSAGTVSVAKISAANILLDGSVYATQLAANSVTASALAANSVAAASIQAGVVSIDKLASDLQTENYTPGGSAGFLLSQTGTSYFNGPVLTRQLQIDSGSYGIGTVNLGFENNSYSTIWEGFIETNIAASAWYGSTKTYGVSVGTYGTVTTGSTDYTNVQWGAEAVAFPVTRYSGAAKIFLHVKLWVRNAFQVSGFGFDWRVYEVT